MALLTTPGGDLAEDEAASNRPSSRRRRAAHRSWRRLLPPAAALVALFALWQLLVEVLSVNPELLPGPRLIVASTWADRADLWPAVLTTTAEAVLGLLLAVVVGLAVAV